MNSTSPLVSILTPGYNVETKLAKFLNSIISQTYKNIELIFINDGSTDNTEKVFFSYEKYLKKKRIKVRYYKQKNKGLGGSINTGLKKINGQFLSWPDQDDFLSDESIAKKVDYLINHESIAVVSSDAYIYEESNLTKPIGKIADNYPQINQKEQFELLINENSIFCPGCHLVRMAALKKVNPKLEIYESRFGQDWQILLPVYYEYNHGYINEPLFNYVIYRNSMSHVKKRPIDTLIKIIEHEKILNNTLKMMNMTKDEYTKYKKIVRNRYLNKKIKFFKDLLLI